MLEEDGEANAKKSENQVVVKQPAGFEKIILNPTEDEGVILELNYCYQIITKKTDQINDQTILVRGTNNGFINRILSKQKFDAEEKVWQRPPSISLVLENVYGALVSDKRHTVMYMHFFNKLDQDVADRVKLKQAISASKALNLGEAAEKKLDFILPRILGTDYQTLLKQHQAIEYDPVHATCHKHILYFSSRIGIMYDANKRV